MKIEQICSAVSLKATQHEARISAARAFLNSHYRGARTYELTVDSTFLTVVTGTAAPASQDDPSQEETPRTITWVTPNGLAGAGAELMVGYTPIARENWTYDRETRRLAFNQGQGASHVSGVMYMLGIGARMKGYVQVGETVLQMTAGLAPVFYDCRIARDAVDKVGQKSVTLRWDTASDEWKNAAWGDAATFRLTYRITEEGSYGGQSVYFVETSFADITTPDDIKLWAPTGGNLGAYTAYATPAMFFDFFVEQAQPPATSSLFPLQLSVQMSPDTSTFTGGMLTGRNDLAGIAYGLQGTFGGTANGLYAVEDGDKVVGIVAAVNGSFRIAGEEVAGLRQDAHGVVWSELPETLQNVSGLPASGRVPLSRSGQFGRDKATRIAFRRVSTKDALRWATKTAKGTALAQVAANLAGESLGIRELESFSQFGKPDGKSYVDVVQQSATADTYNILLFFMDDTLRKQFVSTTKPALDPTIQNIAAMKGAKGEDPAEFYKSLGVSYVAANLGRFSSDTNKEFLNWKRATAWLNEQFKISPVMQAQMPALYANRYAEVNAVGKYLDDQRGNSARYTPGLTQEIDTWIETTVALAVGDDEAQKTIRSDMQALKDATLNQRLYWAYVMCRTFISPNFLAFLQAIGVSPDQGAEASQFARRIQETSALLSVLDPSGLFARKFTEILEAFNLATILPTLVNYSGNADNMLPGIEAALAKFVATYENSPAPGMQDAAEAIRKALVNKQIGDLLDIFANMMSGVAGSYAFEGAIARFQNRVGSIIASGADFVVSGLMVAAISMAIINLATGTTKWDDLTGGQQTAFVAGAAIFIAMAITKIVVRGVAVNMVLAADDGLLAVFTNFFSPFLMQNAQKSMAVGIKGWLVGGNSLEDEISGLQMQRLFAATVAEEAELDSEISWRYTVGKFLGANLDEFIATRLGAVLALGGIAFAIYGLVEATNPFEIAANVMFLAASVLDFFVAVGTWAVAGAAEAIMVGSVALAAILPWLSVFAVAALVIGAVVLIVMMFVLKPEDPLLTFAKKQAADAGFYMPEKYAIDYFEVYQPDGQAQRLGLSLRADDTGHGYLTVAADGKMSIGPLDESAQTVFYVSVDSQGHTGIAAPLQNPDYSAATRLLAVDKDGKTLVALTPDATTATDPNAQWTCTPSGDATKDGSNYLVGSFTMVNAGLEAAGQTKYLGRDGDTPVLSDKPLVWTVQMEPVRILGVRMADVSLKTSYKDQVFAPQLLNVCSGPLAWALSPAAPAFMTFDSTTGKLSQKPQTAPVLTPKTTYTLTVSSAVNSVSCTFSLEVVAAEMLLAA